MYFNANCSSRLSIVEGVGIKPLVHGSMANGDLLTGDKVRVLEVVAVVLPIRSLVDELRVARIAGSPQFEPAGQNWF
jgi:hypothetical protein